jgi:hypothetical protein
MQQKSFLKGTFTVAKDRLLKLFFKKYLPFAFNSFLEKETSIFKIEKLKEKMKSSEVKDIKSYKYLLKKEQFLIELKVKKMDSDFYRWLDSSIEHMDTLNHKKRLSHTTLNDKYLVVFQKQNNQWKNLFIEDVDTNLYYGKIEAHIPDMGMSLNSSWLNDHIKDFQENDILVSLNERWSSQLKYRNHFYSYVEKTIHDYILKKFIKKLSDFKCESFHESHSWSNEIIPEEYYQRLSKNPRVKQAKNKKAQFSSLEKAHIFPYIETESFSFKNTICIDIDNLVDDEDGLYRWKKMGIPAPSIMIFNPSNKKSVQYLYILKTPLSKKSQKAHSYGMDIFRKLVSALSGDISYNGVFCKNPLYHGHKIHFPYKEDYKQGLFELKILNELLKDINLNVNFQTEFNEKSLNFEGLGRNQILFEQGRRFAYLCLNYSINSNSFDFNLFHQSVLNFLLTKNNQFKKCEKGLLPLKEIQSIAKSISTWQWKHYSHIHKNRKDISLKDFELISFVEKELQDGLTLEEISSKFKISIKQVKFFAERILNKIHLVFKSLVIKHFNLPDIKGSKSLQSYIETWINEPENKLFKNHVKIPSLSTIKVWKRVGIDDDLQKIKDNPFKKLINKRKYDKDYSNSIRLEKIFNHLNISFRYKIKNQIKNNKKSLLLKDIQNNIFKKSTFIKNIILSSFRKDYLLPFFDTA